MVSGIPVSLQSSVELEVAHCAEFLLCKYNTSNDPYSRCKSAHKMATRKSDDQRIQPDNKLELGRSYKLKLVGRKMKLGPKVENWL